MVKATSEYQFTVFVPVLYAIRFGIVPVSQPVLFGTFGMAGTEMVVTVNAGEVTVAAEGQVAFEVICTVMEFPDAAL